MRRSEVIATLRAHQSELDALGVTSLSLFGSTARDEAGPDSDVDVLAEFDGGATFDRYMGLVLALQDWLGRRVDVVTPGALRLKPAWRAQIEREALRVA